VRQEGRFDIVYGKFEIYSTDESGRLNIELGSKIFASPRLLSETFIRFWAGSVLVIMNLPLLR
jgi:hypothetical protein